MSNTYTAFQPLPLLDQLPLKIECLEIVRQNQIFIGTADGVLLIYSIRNNAGSDVASSRVQRKPFSIHLEDSLKSFSRKGIKQLKAIEKYNLLISLSDSVYLHSLDSRQPISTIPKSKGCHIFSVDIEDGQVRMCVAIKKKIMLYRWEGREFTLIKELALPDTVRRIGWAGENLCVAYKREYNFINLKRGTMKELFPCGKGTIPLIMKTISNQLLLSKGNISIFIGPDGKPTRRFGLSWSENPQAIGHYFPYVIAILPKYIEVRTMYGKDTLVQTMTMQKAKLIEVSGDVIYIAAANRIWKLDPIPLMDQIDQLCQNGEYDKAILVLENIPQSDKKITSEKLKHIRKRNAYHLFSRGKYDPAMKYFYELSCDPLEVIGLYPNMLPKNYPPFEYPISMPEITKQTLQRALDSLINYLTRIRVQKKDIKDTTSILYAEVKDLATIIDTALLKAYVMTRNKDLRKLLTLPNACHVNESRQILIAYQKFNELVLLYRCKKMHRTALELLARLGQGPKKGSNLHGTASTIQYLRCLNGKEHLDLILEFSKWIMQTNPKEGLTLFTERQQEDMLDAVPVLAFLQENANAMVVDYLEFIIHSNGEKRPLFHNELIFRYLESVLELREQHGVNGGGEHDGQYIRAGTEMGLLGKCRKKLLAFLEQSEHYEPNKILTRFMFSGKELYEERAILLSRIQRHRQALELYVYKIKDLQAAEIYCERHYNSGGKSRHSGEEEEEEDDESMKDVYLNLLYVYLNPPENVPRHLASAFALLNKHYAKINAVKALEMLPEDHPVQVLTLFLEQVLREKTKKKRELQIVKNLLKLEHLRVMDERIAARAKVIKIYNGRICPVCKKDIRGSVFTVYPNGVVVHFMCAKDKYVCPVTGVDFRKKALSS